MRCCCVQLLRKYGNGFAVLSISIVFGLLHGNVIQFVFAFLVGLILGYITVKTDSVVPAILVHALNNGMSVIVSIVLRCYRYGRRLRHRGYVCVLAAGRRCRHHLPTGKKAAVHPKSPSGTEPGSPNLWPVHGRVFDTPGMIVSFIPLVVLTIFSIQKL